ncbi:hypothetical protein FAM09_13510 [Niastella caeni]|uniref:Outer membrane protein beta-barrel domain-containing protein n=1 Tax=Niastella caeni TaxID=2569763 RepID=A0A4V4H186_9BACT|nr:hypothetical protein [Niastella caeni]THU39516.1 hypothetical protein FAM09_13510 [Niastella caeni]
MKKLALVLLATALYATTTQAQFFEKGTNVISAGVGLGGHFGSFTYGSQTPGISVQYEKGIWETGGPGVISLGGYAGVKSYKNSGSAGSYHYTEKWNYTVIGVRSAYHYNGINNEKFDVYGGLMLSYNILSYKFSDNGTSSTYRAGSYGNALGFSAYVGGRYLFTNNIGAFAELGYGVSYLTLGLALKF